MALSTFLAVLCALGFALVACQLEYRWKIVFEPCKDSCGPDEVKQKRAVCVDGLSRPVEEQLCAELEKRFLAADESNRVRRQGHGSPSVSPKFVDPPLLQPRPVRDGSMTIFAGQNVIIHAGDDNHLMIDAVLAMGEPAQITWTLPGGTSLPAGGSSGRFRVFPNGSLLINDIEHPDEGAFTVQATNAVGMDMKSSKVTVRDFFWHILVGSCTHTCGLIGFRPALVLCLDNRTGRYVDEVHCRHRERRPHPPPKACNRFPCPEPPKFFHSEPLVQPRPVPDGSLTISAGQNVIIHARDNHHLMIDAVLVMGEPAQITWTLPGGMRLPAGGSSGRFRVFPNGSLLINDIEHLDEGIFKVKATNPAGMDMKSSKVTVWDFTWEVIIGRCIHTCGLFGFRPALVLCRNNGIGGESVGEVHCRNRERPFYLPFKTCNRFPCPEPPKFFCPEPLMQPSPIPDGSMSISLGQDVTIHSGDGNHLLIDLVLVQGTPDPNITWTLPNSSTLTPGQSSGRFSVALNGSLIIMDIEDSDEGFYKAEATNAVGMDMKSSKVTVWDVTWEVLVGSCTHTCGSFGLRPALVLCRNNKTGGVSVDEVHCRHRERPYHPPPKACNRAPCLDPPKFFDPEPLVQPSPIPDGSMSISLGQDVTIHSGDGNHLLIDLVLVQGKPDPDITWTLPNSSTLIPGQSSGRFSVALNGSLIILDIEHPDEGTFTVKATNAVGMDMESSKVTVWDFTYEVIIGSCTRTCGLFGFRPALMYCSDNKTGGVSVDEVHCRHRERPPHPPFKACNRFPCPEPPKFFHPEPLVQPSPIAVGSMSISVGQDVTMHSGDGNHLLIDIVLVQGTPDPNITWTLPNSSTLTPGQSSGRFSVALNGSLSILDIEHPDEGTFKVKATNAVGMDMKSSKVTVWDVTWEVIIGSCTHTCGSFGFRPALVLCRNNRIGGEYEYEIHCRHRERPPHPPPKACNRFTCPESPKFFDPEPLVQPSPIPDGSMSIFLGQDVTIRSGDGNHLLIDVVLVQGAPDPNIIWTLPISTNLTPGQSSGRFSVALNGSLLILNIAHSDEGTYKVKATNAVGMDIDTSKVTVWDYTWEVIVGTCTQSCGPYGFKPTLVLCRDNSAGRASVDELYCRHRRLPHPLPAPCNRFPCGIVRTKKAK